MSMYALALVESPFHVICLHEAMLAMDIKKVDVLVVTSHSSRNHSQLEHVIQFFPMLRQSTVKLIYCDVDSAVDGSLEERIAVYARPFSLIRKRLYTTLFFSDVRSQWQKDVCSTFSSVDTWLLDDGTATLYYLYYHVPKGKTFSLPQYGTPERRNEAEMIKMKFGLANKDVPNISLFTIFNVHVPEQINYRRNPLRSVSQRFQATDPDTALIVGAKIVERDYCSVEEYHEFIARIIENWTGPVCYVPHRGQSEQFNHSLRERFPTLLFRPIDIPLELWFKQQESPPKHVHGFVSTFFYVASMAFPQLSLTCYAPTTNMLIQADKAGVYGSDCYTNSQAVEVIYRCLPDSVNRVEWVDRQRGDSL